MTGYTVHTGASEQFVEGWDRIFGGAKKPAKSRKNSASQDTPAKAAKSKTKQGKPARSSSAKKSSRGKK